MIDHADHPQPKRASIGRHIRGSFLSAAVGWGSLNFIASVLYLWPPRADQWWMGFLFIGGYSAVFIFGTWLVILLPLYLMIPPRSILWRWPVCTVCGAIGRAAVMAAVMPFSAYSLESSLVPLVIPALVGAVTCLFGSLTARRFQYEQSA